MSGGRFFLFVALIFTTSIPGFASSHPTKHAVRGEALIVIPDQSHGSEKMFQFEMATLHRLGREFSGKTKCLFLEVDADFNPVLRSYFNRQQSYQASVGAAISRYVSKIEITYINLMPHELLDEASRDQFQVFGTDDLHSGSSGMLTVGIMARVAGYDSRHQPYPFPLLQQMALISIQGRSQKMALELAHRYQASQCQVGVLVVGAAHTKDWIGSVQVIPIQSQLSGEGFSSTILETSDLK